MNHVIDIVVLVKNNKNMKKRLSKVTEIILSVILLIVLIIVTFFLGGIYMLYLCVSLPVETMLLPLVVIIWIVTGKWFPYYISRLPMKLADIVIRKIKQ